MRLISAHLQSQKEDDDAWFSVQLHAGKEKYAKCVASLCQLTRAFLLTLVGIRPFKMMLLAFWHIHLVKKSSIIMLKMKENAVTNEHKSQNLRDFFFLKKKVNN